MRSRVSSTPTDLIRRGERWMGRTMDDVISRSLQQTADAHAEESNAIEWLDINGLDAIHHRGWLITVPGCLVVASMKS